MLNSTGDISAINYVFQGFGVFLGVIAGTAITIGTKLFFSHHEETQKLKNLKFELALNVKKIDSWLKEMQCYRNAVNGDSIQNYHGYFDLSRFVSVTANAMFNSGALYKYFTHKEIEKLQIIYADFSLQGENYLNSEIASFKNDLSNWQNNKPSAVGKIDFWEERYNDHKNVLLGILSKDILKKIIMQDSSR